MTRRYYSSTAQRTTLASPLSAGSTTVIVSSITGFPTSRPYTLIIDPDGIKEEIVTVTAVSGTTLTVVRGEDGTTAVAHNLGAVVWHGLTGRDLGEPQAHMDASSGVHAVTGNVVGTSDTQILTGKSMSGADNTFSSIPQSAVTGLMSDLAAKAPSASPTFTGTVTLPAATSIGNVSDAELGRLDGVTSNVQTQLTALDVKADTKAPIASPTFTGTVVLPSSTSIGNVSATEIGYLDGVTSSIQQQITDTQNAFGPIPAGGNANDILVKLSGDDYDFAWKPASELLFIPGTGNNIIYADGSMSGGDSTGTFTLGSQTFRYHTFTTTSVTQSLTVTTAAVGRLLVVGGGGGGGGYSQSAGSSTGGAGGGAGALWFGDYAFGVGLHDCVVGVGGAGGAGAGLFNDSFDGNNGNASWFDYNPSTMTGGIYCQGGGGGAGVRWNAGGKVGKSGGSGGGGYDNAAGGSGQSGYGYAGGTRAGGGDGGGAGGTGTIGGPGVTLNVTGSSIEYGKGGAGMSSATPAANRGNGGGGAASGGTSPNTGASGGSGVIIACYRIG